MNRDFCTSTGLVDPLLPQCTLGHVNWRLVHWFCDPCVRKYHTQASSMRSSSMCVWCKCIRKSHYFHEQFSNNNHCHNHCNHGRLWPDLNNTTYYMKPNSKVLFHSWIDWRVQKIHFEVDLNGKHGYFARLDYWHGSYEEQSYFSWIKEWENGANDGLYIICISVRAHSIVNADCCAYSPQPSPSSFQSNWRLLYFAFFEGGGKKSMRDNLEVQIAKILHPYHSVSISLSRRVLFSRCLQPSLQPYPDAIHADFLSHRNGQKREMHARIVSIYR